MRPDDVELPRQRPSSLHRHTNAVGGRRARLSGKRGHGRERKTHHAKHARRCHSRCRMQMPGPVGMKAANPSIFPVYICASARYDGPTRRPRRSGGQQQNRGRSDDKGGNVMMRSTLIAALVSAAPMMALAQTADELKNDEKTPGDVLTYGMGYSQ